MTISCPAMGRIHLHAKKQPQLKHLSLLCMHANLHKMIGCMSNNLAMQHYSAIQLGGNRNKAELSTLQSERIAQQKAVLGSLDQYDTSKTKQLTIRCTMAARALEDAKQLVLMQLPQST